MIHCAPHLAIFFHSLPRLLQRLESCEAQLRRSETALGAKGEELDKLKELLTGAVPGAVVTNPEARDGTCWEKWVKRGNGCKGFGLERGSLKEFGFLISEWTFDIKLGFHIVYSVQLTFVVAQELVPKPSWTSRPS